MSGGAGAARMGEDAGPAAGAGAGERRRARIEGGCAARRRAGARRSTSAGAEERVVVAVGERAREPGAEPLEEGVERPATAPCERGHEVLAHTGRRRKPELRKRGLGSGAHAGEPSAGAPAAPGRGQRCGTCERRLHLVVLADLGLRIVWPDRDGPLAAPSRGGRALSHERPPSRRRPCPRPAAWRSANARDRATRRPDRPPRRTAAHARGPSRHARRRRDGGAPHRGNR